MIPMERDSAAENCWKSFEQLATWDKMYSPETCTLFPNVGSKKFQQNETIYISGPVTGIPEHNKPKFLLAEKMLLSYGCHVFNPTHIEGPIDPLEGEALWQYYMHFCVRALPECEGILMLPDWQNSKGAKWEHRIAEMLGLAVYYSPVPDHE
jgi:hypothetical protein